MCVRGHTAPLIIGGKPNPNFKPFWHEACMHTCLLKLQTFDSRHAALESSEQSVPSSLAASQATWHITTSCKREAAIFLIFICDGGCFLLTWVGPAPSDGI
jgi:hypothetical protein